MKKRRIFIILFALSILSTGCGSAAPKAGTEVTSNEDCNVSTAAITGTTEDDGENNRKNTNAQNESKNKEDGAKTKDGKQPVTKAGECGGVSILLPEGWNYETYVNEEEGEISGYGIKFNPEDVKEGYIELGYNKFFGVCGTGLEEKTVKLAGDIANEGYYDGSDIWSFVSYRGKNEKIVAVAYSTDEWWSEYSKEVGEILDSMVYNEEQRAFLGIIDDVNGGSVIVTPSEDSIESRSSDKYSVDTKMFPSDYVPKVGDKVEIAYSGGILETYPAKFGDIAHIELLDKDHKKADKDEVSMEELSKEFYYTELNKDIKTKITGCSYPDTKDKLEISYGDLVYVHVLHYDFKDKVSEGELICNKKIAQDLVDIFKELFENKYQIERIKLIDEYKADDLESMADNNSSAFNYRVISGTDRLSNHSYGMAIDINPLYNPYVFHRNGKDQVQPLNAQDYVDRDKEFEHKIDHEDLCYKLFIEHGFTWGGDWKNSKDYQHFEKV